MTNQCKFNKGISTLIGILIVVVFAVIVGRVLYLQLSKEKVEIPGVKVPEEIAPEEKITDETANWKTYRNEEYGFEVKYPTSMLYENGGCRWNTSNGDHSYRPEPKIVPTKIFEDQDNNKVYISSEYYYMLGGGIIEKNISYFSECNKVNNSLALLRDKNNSYQKAWEIVIKDINTDEGLDAFIKERYGEGCSLGDKVSLENDVYKITIRGDGKDLEYTKCPLNYMTVLRYNTKKKEVVSWNLGQSCTFYKSSGLIYSGCNDEEMFNSFKFIE